MYCFKRGHYWHFRIRVPADLSGAVGSAEISRSLKTQDGRTARGLAATYRNLYQSAFDQLRLARLSGMEQAQLGGFFRAATEVGEHTRSSGVIYRLSDLVRDYLQDRHTSSWRQGISLVW